MHPTKIITFDYLKNSKIAHAKVSNSFKKYLKNNILSKYKSLKEYHREKLDVNYRTIIAEFRLNRYFKFNRLLKIIEDFNIPRDQLYDEISALFARGSNTSKELKLNKELIIDEFFVEGYALYLAEGDNGSNGKTIPRKVRLINSEYPVLKNFQNWLDNYFPNNHYYFLIITPHNKVFTAEHYNFIKDYFNLNDNQIKTKVYQWKRRTGFVYKICLVQKQKK